ncbi:MAG TPA: isoprenylcysteine carboxylmethyltransferase family protein [Roseiarcus sp.]|jgi:protein-S-isoprenylcysteine O-methyltransferase Ste14|nr:isoprenylcysteine carboxylmethyltransferase family protein [Roseiarcus sp.]
MIVVRSILHNLAVTAVAFLVALVGAGLDRLFKIGEFRSPPAAAVGALLMCIGFLIRFWATYYFYTNGMKVISTVPQGTLLTSGPYNYSRNPLYLGGNIFMFFGAGLILGSPAALAVTALHLPFVDLFIRSEEKQLEQRFGEDWVRYRRSVRRWI